MVVGFGCLRNLGDVVSGDHKKINISVKDKKVCSVQLKHVIEEHV